MATAVWRSPRSGLLLRIPALAIVGFRLAFLFSLVPGYVATFERLGFGTHTLTITLDHVAFVLALFFLLADWLRRRRGSFASRGIHPAQS